jgi:hypothetical protein
VTSTVTNYTKTFDETYPKAGADNNSQQFRDNFAAIKVAFTATSNELSDLQSKVVLKSALAGGTLDNDFAYNSISNVNLVNHSYTVKNWVDTVPTAVNYSQGQYQSLVLPSGVNTVNITGVPTATEDNEPRMGSMIVVVSTSSAATTTVSFTSDVEGISVVNLGPTAQPFAMDDNIPLMFEIWATSGDPDEPTVTPRLYIKKLTEFIKPNIYDYNNVSGFSFLGDNATFVDTVRAGRSISIGNNTYTTGTTTGTVGATIVGNGTYYNNLALVPNQVIGTVNGTTPTNQTSGIATKIYLASVNGIYVGSSVFVKSTSTALTVSQVNPADVPPSVTVNSFPVGTGIDFNGKLTFTNPAFPGQATVATYATTSTSTNLIGSITANTSTLNVVFKNFDGVSTNTFTISNVLVNSITAGSGTSVSSVTGNVIFTNTGVLSITASATTSGIYVNNSTGYVVIAPSTNSNGFGQRFISSSAPGNSDGVNGDIWYKI